MQTTVKTLLSPQQTNTFAFTFSATLILCLAQPRMLSFLPEIVALVCGAFYFVAKKRLPACDRPLALFIAAFFILTAVSALWSPDPSYAFSKVARTAALVFFGYVLVLLAQTMTADGMHKKQLFYSLAAGHVFFGLLFFIEYTFHYPVMRFMMANIFHAPAPLSIENAFLFNRSSVFLVLYTAPLLYMLRGLDFPHGQKIFFSLLPIFSLLLALLNSESQTAQITAVVMAIMHAFPGHRKKARLFFTGILAAGFLVMPLLPIPAYDYLIRNNLAEKADGFVMKASIPQRLEVWSFAAREIFKKPFFGHGVEATRALKSEKIMPYFHTDHVLHPHNFALQIWIETGLAGILLAAVFFFFLIRRMDDVPPATQKFYMVLFAGILSVLAMGYGMWQAWQVGMIMAITAFAIMATKFCEPVSRA